MLSLDVLELSYSVLYSLLSLLSRSFCMLLIVSCSAKLDFHLRLMLFSSLNLLKVSYHVTTLLKIDCAKN